jgi:hypothetical protein
VHDAPLGLPKGSIRAIISLIVVVAVVIGSIGFQTIALGETFKPILGVIVGFYFGTRIKESNGGK